MSFYGYTPVADDYSYVAKAGEGFGKAAAGVVGAVGGAMQKKAFNTAYKTLEEEKLAEAEAVFGGDKSAAAAAFKRNYYRMNGETPEQFNARRAKMDEGFEKELAKQRHKQGANELRSQMKVYTPGGVVQADAPQGGQALTMPGGTQTWSERLRNLSPFNSDGTIQPGSADEVTKAQFGPQNGLGAKQPGIRALNTSADAQRLQAQAGVTPEQTGGWKAQQGGFYADRPRSERLSTLNNAMNDDKISEGAYGRLLKELELEATNEKDKAAAAAVLAKEKHADESAEKQRDWQSKEKDLDRKSAQYIAALRKYRSNGDSANIERGLRNDIDKMDNDIGKLESYIAEFKSKIAMNSTETLKTSWGDIIDSSSPAGIDKAKRRLAQLNKQLATKIENAIEALNAARRINPNIHPGREYKMPEQTEEPTPRSATGGEEEYPFDAWDTRSRKYKELKKLAKNTPNGRRLDPNKEYESFKEVMNKVYGAYEWAGDDKAGKWVQKTGKGYSTK